MRQTRNLLYGLPYRGFESHPLRHSFPPLSDQGITCSMSRRGDCWDDAAIESFFSTLKTERQVRTLAGLPLGDTTMRSPVVMQNLLGDLWAGGIPCWQALLADSSATLHLYGKAEPRHDRKMGHFSCIAATVDEALDAALRLRRLLPASAHADCQSEIAATI
jgi:transposase InsO family protein